MTGKIEVGHFFGNAYGDLRKAYDAIVAACGSLAKYFAADDVIRLINSGAEDSATFSDDGHDVKIDMGSVVLYDKAYVIQVVEAVLSGAKDQTYTNWHCSPSDSLMELYEAQYAAIRAAERSLMLPVRGPMLRGAK